VLKLCFEIHYACTSWV